jgi:type I restriction enzyme, S subunit
MAVDSLRDTFHVNRVQPEEIGLLLSAQSYRPDITKAISQIKSMKNWQSLQSICSEPITQGQSPVYALSGHPCLKTRNVLDLIISLDNVDLITPESAKQLERFAVKYQTILMNRSGAGSIGRVAIYLGEESPRTNEHLFRIVVAHPYDPAYICCFLASWWGERGIEQGISGTTGQLNLGNEYIRLLPIPVPDSKVQKYIGDKVRQAGRLRDRSRCLLNSAELILDNLINGNVNEEELTIAKLEKHRTVKNKVNQRTDKRWVRRVPGDEMDYRIDCQFYNPSAKAIIEKLKKLDPKPLSNFVVKKVSEPPIHTDHYGQEGIHIISPANFSDYKVDLEKTNKLNPSYIHLFKDFLLQEGDLIFALVGDVGHACAVTIPVPEGITYRRTAHFKLQGINPFFVCAFLNSSAGDLQLKRMTTGVIQAQLRLEDSVEVLIPSFKPETQNWVGDCVKLSIQMREQSETLTIGSKLLVEALIEGKLSESDLKAAQEGLEKGDTTLDREILARLTRKGIDRPNEPPLFPDLDALYNALASLNKTEAIEAANPGNSRAAKVYHLHGTPLALASEAPETSYAKPKEVPE